MAAEYIGNAFRSVGLEPFEDGSYLQEFPYGDGDGKESNVVGIIKGVAGSTKSLVFTAHYDAFGIRPEAGRKDSIYNGARDNAVGVAALIELARLFAMDAPPAHNLVFVATSAEEFGLHGSRYYVAHPAFPAEEIILCLNIDGFNVTGPREDYFIMPRQGIDFVDDIQAILAPHGWVYNSPEWVDGMNTMFDTASFLQAGIPAVTIWTGERLKGGGIAKPANLAGIHSAEDEVTDLWDWSGIEDHLQLYKRVATHFLEHPEGIRVTEPGLFEPGD